MPPGLSHAGILLGGGVAAAKAGLLGAGGFAASGADAAALCAGVVSAMRVGAAEAGCGTVAAAGISETGDWAISTQRARLKSGQFLRQQSDPGVRGRCSFRGCDCFFRRYDAEAKLKIFNSSFQFKPSLCRLK